jgi:hypothetical protein
MAKTKRNVAMAAAVAAVVAVAGQSAAADAASPTVVLHVENFAQIPADMLSDAESEARSIYDAAGIQTVWTNEDAGIDDSDPSTLHLTVLLLTRNMSAQKIRKDRVGNGVMGQAARPTRRAYIFTFRITDTASMRGAFATDLLGKVLAHEVGHLLLPTPGHSDQGIMTADLQLSPTRVPRFTTEQSEAMRTALLDGRF